MSTTSGMFDGEEELTEHVLQDIAKHCTERVCPAAGDFSFMQNERHFLDTALRTAVECIVLRLQRDEALRNLVECDFRNLNEMSERILRAIAVLQRLLEHRATKDHKRRLIQVHHEPLLDAIVDAREYISRCRCSDPVTRTRKLAILEILNQVVGLCDGEYTPSSISLAGSFLEKVSEELASHEAVLRCTGASEHIEKEKGALVEKVRGLRSYESKNDQSIADDIKLFEQAAESEESADFCALREAAGRLGRNADVRAYLLGIASSLSANIIGYAITAAARNYGWAPSLW